MQPSTPPSSDQQFQQFQQFQQYQDFLRAQQAAQQPAAPHMAVGLVQSSPSRAPQAAAASPSVQPGARQFAMDAFNSGPTRLNLDILIAQLEGALAFWDTKDVPIMGPRINQVASRLRQMRMAYVGEDVVLYFHSFKRWNICKDMLRSCFRSSTGGDYDAAKARQQAFAAFSTIMAEANSVLEHVELKLQVSRTNVDIPNADFFANERDGGAEEAGAAAEEAERARAQR